MAKKDWKPKEVIKNFYESSGYLRLTAYSQAYIKDNPKYALQYFEQLASLFSHEGEAKLIAFCARLFKAMGEASADLPLTESEAKEQLSEILKIKKVLLRLEMLRASGTGAMNRLIDARVQYLENQDNFDSKKIFRTLRVHALYRLFENQLPAKKGFISPTGLNSSLFDRPGHRVEATPLKLTTSTMAFMGMRVHEKTVSRLIKPRK